MFVIITFIFVIVALVIAFAGSKRIRINEIELNKYQRKRFERVRWIFNEQLPASDCPVMFLRGAVLRDKSTGKHMLQLKFINTGIQAIKSAYTSIDFIDDAGDIIANNSTIQAEYLDINCASKDSFGQKQLFDLGGIGATRIIVTYSKVVFADGTVWRAAQNSQTSKPVIVTLLKDTLPPELQNEVSEKNICKPEVLNHELWRCTCGCLVRSADGVACPNCQQTFEQAQEAVSISALEKQMKRRIAEQEQRALDEQIAKNESKDYTKQLFYAILTVTGGSSNITMVCVGFEEIGLPVIIAVVLGVLLSCLCYSSLIATALLVRNVRKNGSIKGSESVRKLVRVQEMALIPCLLNVMCGILGVLCLITAAASIKYCSGFPSVKNWLVKRKSQKQKK